MPKARIRKSKDRNARTVPVKVSHKIGGRKSAKSAHMMTTADLLETYENTPRKKDKAKIATVLRQRNVALPA